MYKYYSVPVVDGGIEDKSAYPFIAEGLQSEPDNRLIKIREDYPAQPSWTEITEEEYNTAKELLLNPPEPEA
jgi:hypothetical protein